MSGCRCRLLAVALEVKAIEGTEMDGETVVRRSAMTTSLFLHWPSKLLPTLLWVRSLFSVFILGGLKVAVPIITQ